MSKGGMAALFVFAAALAACSESAVGPRAATSRETTSTKDGGSNAVLTSGDTVRFSITIDPAHKTTYSLGNGNSLYFPAHSLCDPTQSSYGMGEWDKPCVQATQPLTISVKAWSDAYGHPRIDFSPSVRFVPSNDSKDWVIIAFSDYQASLDPVYNILYCPEITGPCIDESKMDSTLATVRDPKNGKVTRRVKHFSGYNVAAGDSGDGLYDLSSNSVETARGTVAQLNASSVFPMRSDANVAFHRAARGRRRSGYVLASG